jgi:hypothetical protein
VFTEVIRQHSASLHAIKTAKKVKTFALFLKVVSLPRDLDPWLRIILMSSPSAGN